MSTIISNEENIRLDKYLSNETKYSREFIQKLINQNLVLVNNKPTKPSYKVALNDEITFNPEKLTIETNIKPVAIPLDIVYEDDYLMVINKPSGLVVHPGSGNYSNTLVNGLMYYTKNLSNLGGEERPGIVHRIDKDTSGLLLIAKTNKVHELLSDDFKNKRIHREYLALLKGVLKEGSATIDAPIGRDKNNREKMCVTGENSKEAITNIKVLKRYQGYTLVSCILKTGRTHQIRVNTSYIGYPIYNDPIYTNGTSTPFGQFLHSHKMSFIHPITKKEMSFTCPLPEEFADFLTTLEPF